MAITYSLAPMPKWVLINNEGTVAGGAKLYTYRSLNKIQPKTVYQDAGGTIPWTNPIIFDLNGVQGPFYWRVDSADLEDTYYLEAYDADDNLLWTVDNFFPSGSGGGGTVTTYVPIQNYITNNQFIDHINDTGSLVAISDLIIAPSNHQGFTPAMLNPLVGTFGVLGGDIRFVRNIASTTPAIDTISFPLFALASAPLTGDVTPVDYVRYQCANNPVGETYKSFQFPITQKVKNLSNQDMTFRIWAKTGTGTVDINVYVRQYFGSGTAASAEVRTLVGTISLDTTWTPYPISLVIPDVAGKSLGTPGQQTDDDALYMQLEMPLDASCDIWFTKPALYLGDIDPDSEFDSYDQINSINSTPRCMDIKPTYWSAFTFPKGWIPLDDGTIGNVGSGANREGQQYFQLYASIYTSINNAFAPVSGGRSGGGNTVSEAITDFIAGKTLTLPAVMGRAAASAGSGAGLTAYAVGQPAGAESSAFTLIAANLPPHTHTYTNSSIPGFAYNFAPGALLTNAPAQQTGNGPGTSTPVNVTTVSPIACMNFFIKL